MILHSESSQVRVSGNRRSTISEGVSSRGMERCSCPSLSLPLSCSPTHPHTHSQTHAHTSLSPPVPGPVHTDFPVCSAIVQFGSAQRAKALSFPSNNTSPPRMVREKKIKNNISSIFPLTFSTTDNLSLYSAVDSEQSMHTLALTRPDCKNLPLATREPRRSISLQTGKTVRKRRGRTSYELFRL